MKKRWTLARNPAPCTLAEVRAQIRAEIECIGTSFQESDGVVRDSAQIDNIGRLQAALAFLPKRNEKRT